ncbi:hypothetical protein [Streptomyces cacaoi]|uniref:hypothetical protein n=1 Tax=Streptomyces cacaoi TaxID=1898 RepID=UPI00374A593E
MERWGPDNWPSGAEVQDATGRLGEGVNPEGELNLESVLVGMAAAPFLQAVVTEFGNRVAVTVGETLTAAINRIKRSRHEQEAPEVQFIESSGWIVMIEPGTSIDALDRLMHPGLRGATTHDYRDKLVQNYVIAWRDDDWRFLPVTNVSIEGFHWNAETRQWETERQEG